MSSHFNLLIVYLQLVLQLRFLNIEKFIIVYHTDRRQCEAQSNSFCSTDLYENEKRSANH